MTWRPIGLGSNQLRIGAEGGATRDCRVTGLWREIDLASFFSGDGRVHRQGDIVID